MTGWGAHGFDVIQWALGTSLTGPTEIWTEGEPFAPPTWSEPDDRAVGDRACAQPLIRMRYAHGVLVKMDVKDQRGGGTFIGDKGSISIDRNYLKSDPAEIVIEAERGRRFAPGDNIRDHLANWVECIKSRQQPIADVEIGHRSATVCHLGNIARWAGRKLQWDPDQEKFVGDDEANQYLERPQRAGFEIPNV
jgi:hypothetical protein